MKTRRAFFVLFILFTFSLSASSPVVTGSETGPAALAAPEQTESTDVQVNWSAGDLPPKTTQSETSIRVNPNTGTICVAYNDSQTDDTASGRTGFSRSTDGGRTFVDGGGFPDGPTIQMLEIANADPSLVWRAADNSFYYAAVKVGLGLYLWVSTDDCETFSYYSTVDIRDPDKEMMTIDNNPDSGNYGRFYLAWFDSLGISVSHSVTVTEESATWTLPDQIRAPTYDGEKVHAPWPAVDPTTGDVYVAWTRWHTGYKGFMDIEIKRSTDGGGEWDFVNSPLILGSSPHDLAATAACPGPALNGHLKYYAFSQIVVDSDSNLHVVYARDPDGVDVGDVVNVYYRRSTDQGINWGPEIQLNDDATMSDQWAPTVSVGPTGTVVATWYDRRNDAGRNYLFDYYMGIS